MDEFMRKCDKLPHPLDEKEQELLLYEYVRTRNINARERLIIHNQRMCADYAIKYCLKNNITKDIEDVYYECVVALVNAIDDYDVTKGKLSTVANKYFETQLFNSHVKESNDAINKTIEHNFLDKDDGEIEMGEMRFFIDDFATNFRQECADPLFVKEVLRFIDTLDEKTSKIIKMKCGIGGYERCSEINISIKLHVSEYMINKLFEKGKRIVENFVVAHYPKWVLNRDFAHKEVHEPCCKQFNTKKDRNRYIWNARYGIDGEQKTLPDIAKDVGMNVTSVSQILSIMKAALSKEEQANLPKPINKKSSLTVTDMFKQRVFDAFYGLNGNPVHTIDEISQMPEIMEMYCNWSEMLNIADSILEKIRAEYISEGRYTAEQIEELSRQRKIRLHKCRLDSYQKYAYEYYSYRGTNGYNKKSLFQLCRELQISPKSVMANIERYGEYLASIEEDEKSLN